MRRIFLLVIAIAYCVAGNAIDKPCSITAGDDTTKLMSIEQIIAQESKSQYDNNYVENLRNIWSKNMFLNLIYNTSHKMSSEEFPSSMGEFPAEYECKFGAALEWGQTFNFHKKPIGNVLFIGLDYTWMDLSFNQFEKKEAPKYEDGTGKHNMPWHFEKTTFGYGMSLGPSLTFYPFTSIRNSGANNIRLQLYFHVGYGIQGTIIKDAILKDGQTKNGFAYGHGLYTAFGGNLSWKFIGIGYEVRNDNNIKYKVVDKDYDTGKLKIKEETNRLYLQFRF